MIYVFTFRYAKKNFDAYLLMPGLFFSSVLMVGQTVYYYFSIYPELANGFKIGVYTKFEYDYRVYLIHQLYMVMCFLSMYKLKVNQVETGNEKANKVSGKITEILNKQYFPANEKTLRFFYILFVGLLAMTLYHFSNLDTKILWQNNQYLLLGNPDELNLPPIASIIHFAAGIIAILVLILSLLMYKSGRYIMGTLLIPFFLYYLLLKVAGNSRWAPLIVVSALPFLYKPKSIRSVISISACLLLTLLLYIGVLYGRNAANRNTQGIAAISGNIRNGIEGAALLFPKIATTAFSSGWNLSLSLKKFETKDVSFDLKYKMLVFSPLISSIDGYNDKLEDKNRLLLSPYAPVGFIGETYFLGAGFFLFAIFFLYFAVRYCNKIVARYNLLGMLLLSPAFLFFFKMQGYPVRNCFRYLIIGIILGYMLNWFQKRKAKRNLYIETSYHSVKNYSLRQ
ncbi:hypothetical protein FRZ67_15060 [Panacibacter ginsenosidivorans]|uniref:Oligosaccharide repeat unit polymerase n=1 Tax=Panacibacter ginsenosidivorans TaxID=1813871 RepID=A0A5B8VCA0_9BACT|nr:hypothetical protein [Panacibacter ginsenosidivorans]QEC68561.1 hypothetical protein FRZ67_15060 [Panacibacter ginsenosidivorans]